MATLNGAYPSPLPEPISTATASDFDQVVALLSRGRSITGRSRPVEVVETHISVLFLGPDVVYKLKKPVKFDFLDFSTPDARRRACEDEVRLNRRLAPDVYLGVEPISRGSRGALRLGPGSQTIDWVVKMRRLDTARTLDTLIQRRALTDAHVAQLASVLADFYAQASPLTIVCPSYCRQIESHVRANLRDLTDADHGLPLEQLRRVHAAQLGLLVRGRDLFCERVCDGRIVEGHGDLRPEHICLESPPVVFDCVEFNREFRCVDVADELSFLAMECDLLGAPSVGQRVLAAYMRRSGDRPREQLLDFYKSYRACVRAKVAALRGLQLAGESQRAAFDLARRYLDLADRAARSFHRPLLLVVRGLSGTGKSTLAQELARHFAADLLQTDQVRRELHGAAARGEAYGADRYAAAARGAVYEALATRAGERLAAGLPVVLDGTYLTRAQRDRVRALARQHRAVPLLIRCECDEAVARDRVARRLAEDRETLSDARPELLARQREEQESDAGEVDVWSLDTTRPLGAQLESVLERLGESS